MQMIDFSSGLSYSQPSFTLGKGTSRYHVSFDVYLEDLDGGTDDTLAVIFDTPIVRTFLIRGDGSLFSSVGGAGTILAPGTLANDTWMHFDILVDFSVSTWTITLDDALIHTGPFTSSSNPPDITSIRFSLSDGDDDSDSVVYMDNIRMAEDEAVQPQEDNYEPNNLRTEAFDLSGSPDTWLSAIDGLGIQRDEDWYQISTAATHNRITADCTFTHAEGDIDIVLYSSSGAVLTGSYGSERQ